MKEGTPTYDQMCRIVGAIYADAYLRLEFLESENKKLREDQQAIVASLTSSLDSLREERNSLKAQLEARAKWTNGNGNSMLPESLLEKLASESTTQHSTSSRQPENNDLPPPKFIETQGETLS